MACGSICKQQTSNVITLEQALKRIPQWTNTQVKAASLNRGLTNNSFLVTHNDQRYVLRINHSNSPALGLDRDRELKVLWFAYAAGLGAEPIYMDSEILVTRWIEGGSLTSQDLGREETIIQIAKVFRQLHNWAITGPKISMAKTATQYLILAPEDKQQELKGLEQEAVAIVAQLNQNPVSNCLCHNDPLHSNFLSGENLRLIDWEYSAWGDPLFDLATLAYYHKFGPQQIDLLLSVYFGRLSSSERLAFDLNVMLSRCLALLWTEAIATTGFFPLEKIR